jgi:DNA-binding NarL/FixJ family response regulator
MAATQHDPGREHVRAVVAAEQSLIVEAVCTALNSSGVESEPTPWPGTLPGPRTDRRPDDAPAEETRVAGLLVCDLREWRQIRAAGLVLHRRPIPWAVLTAAAPGPLWGALYEHGATVVLTARTALEQVVTMLTALALGERGVGPSPEQRMRFQMEWRELCERRADLSNRTRALTPREREVLTMLYEGATIAEIAALLQIAPSTVRSQVKAVRQKLGVSSQLAAVAAYGSLIGPDPGRPVVRS